MSGAGLHGFRETGCETLKDNPFLLIGRDWMLLAAGNEESFNMMTASWGGMGVLWNKNVVWSFVRPSRYTYSFMERETMFSLSFFDPRYRDALNFCGSHTGREVNKVAQTGLTPLPGNPVFFAEARLVLVCRKIYYQDLDPSKFIDTNIERNYSGTDYHRVYTGEIVQCLTKGPV